MPRFDACLLDYGNTVVEFDKPQIGYVLERLGRHLRDLVGPVDPATLEREMERICALPYQGDPPDLREVSPRRQMELLLEACYQGHLQISAPLVAEGDRRLQECFVDSIDIEEDVLEALGRLSSSMRVGLVSNYPASDALRRSLERTGVAGIVDPLVISGDIGYVKPHRSVFQAALDALGFPAENVLFVGDRWDADMIGARDAGMGTCHHVGYTSDLDLEERYRVYQPDFQIRHLRELEELLEV